MLLGSEEDAPDGIWYHFDQSFDRRVIGGSDKASILVKGANARG